jgi:hypothetical protein
MGCSIGQSTLFGTNDNKYLKFQGSDLIAIDGPNTVERQLLGSIRFPYKQLLKGRIILKPGQVNYLLNHLGLGDNATVVSLSAKYDEKSKIEEDNYILWSFYDDLTNTHPMCQYMLLTGNSSNRVKQLYLTNPSSDYSVTLDVIVANIDDTYNFFNDVINQSGTSFVNLELTNIKTYVVNESIVVNDQNNKPLIYILLSNIESLQISGQILTIDDSSMGKIFLHFKNEYEAKQANSLLNYILENLNININTLNPVYDNTPPVLYWLSTVGASSSTSYIDFNGATSGVPYDTTIGNTFSTSISFGSYATSSKITKTQLLDLVIDYADDNRDGIIILSTQSLILSGTTSTNVDHIDGLGTYSLTFNFSDIAGNDISNVKLNLTITS